MTDQELTKLVASLAISQAKTDEQMKKTDQELTKLVNSIAISQAKTDEQMKKTDQELTKLADSIAIAQAKTDEQMSKTDKKLKSIGIQLGNISNNQGNVAEEFFVNSLSEKLKVADIQYDEIHKNMNKKTKKIQGEFDIVLVNGKDIAIIEIKYKAHNDDLDDLINKKLKIFKELYPEYNNYNHHLGLASFYINEDLKKKALKNNVFVLQRKGEIIESFLPH